MSDPKQQKTEAETDLISKTNSPALALLTDELMSRIWDILLFVNLALVCRSSKEMKHIIEPVLKKRSERDNLQGLASLVYKPNASLPDSSLMTRVLFALTDGKQSWERAIRLVGISRRTVARRIGKVSSDQQKRRFARLVTLVACVMGAICTKEPKAVMTEDVFGGVKEILTLVLNPKGKEMNGFRDFCLERLSRACICMLRKCVEEGCDEDGEKRMNFLLGGDGVKLMESLIYSEDRQMLANGCIMIRLLMDQQGQIEMRVGRRLVEEGIYDILTCACKERLEPLTIADTLMAYFDETEEGESGPLQVLDTFAGTLLSVLRVTASAGSETSGYSVPQKNESDFVRLILRLVNTWSVHKKDAIIRCALYHLKKIANIGDMGLTWLRNADAELWLRKAKLIPEYATVGHETKCQFSGLLDYFIEPDVL